jgi:hemoglobin/transferrin/lactoferrin receptor protein
MLLAIVSPVYATDSITCSDMDQCHDGILEEIVVTGTRTDRTILENPATLSVVTAAEIESINADTIADLVRHIPGISISDSGQAGLKRIRIRGEEARRVALLIDGQEFTDHREVGVPLLIDPSSVERIEVVRGPASVLYGAKALGGVVNIITRRGGPEPLQLNLSSTYDSATEGLHNIVSLNGQSNDFYYRFAVTDNKQKDRDTPDGKMENTSYNSDSITASLGKSFSSDGFAGEQSVELVYEDFDSDSEVYVEPEVRFAPPFLDFAIDAPQRDREKVGFFYQFEPDHQYLANGKINLFHQVSDRQFNTFPSLFVGFRQDSSIYTTSELTSEGGVAQLDWQLGENNYLISGIQYNRDRVDQSRLREVSINLAPPSSEEIDDRASMTTWAFFLQDEWSMADDWTMTAGLRQYSVDAGLDATTRDDLTAGDLDDDELIGSIALLYSGYENTTVRVMFSQGYIYPSLLQMAMGAYAGSRFVNPNLELDPETSDTFEIGMRHQGSRWTLDTTAFFTRSENYIDHLFCTPDDQCLGRRDKKYKNISESDSYGLEIHLAYQADGSSISPYANLGYFHRENDFDTFSTTDSGVPDFQGNIGFHWQRGFGSNHIESNLFVRFESDSKLEEPGSSVIVVKDNAGWGTLNADIGIKFGERYRIGMNLVNLLDKEYSSSTENLLAPGRSIRVRLALQL